MTDEGVGAISGFLISDSGVIEVQDEEQQFWDGPRFGVGPDKLTKGT